MPRKPHTTPDDVPATVPAVVPLRRDWSEWSVDRERKRLEAEIEERARIVTEPIYPREIAARMAKDAARLAFPDWRLFREEYRALFVKLLRDQPELQQREVRQFDALLRLIGDNLPAHLQPLIRDVRTILELRILGHERAAFMVGCETGRQQEQQHGPAPGPRRTRATHPRPQPDPRLHVADDE